MQASSHYKKLKAYNETANSGLHLTTLQSQGIVKIVRTQLNAEIGFFAEVPR